MVRRLHIVSYDIRCPKRWRRVFALMRRSGEHRQLSVFLVKMDRRGIKRLVSNLDNLIEAEEDTVLIAPVGRGEADGMIELGIKSSALGARILII